MNADTTPRLRVQDFEWHVNQDAVPDRDGVPGTDGAPASLYAKMQIGTAEFHVNAYLMEWVMGGTYYRNEPQWDGSTAVHVELGRNEKTTDHLWHAFGMDGAPETVTISVGIDKEREYAIFVEPFGR